jgi:hypothetical protein
MEFKDTKVIDEMIIDIITLADAIKNYHELGYLVSVTPVEREDSYGNYAYHEYRLKVIKIEYY